VTLADEQRQRRLTRLHEEFLRQCEPWVKLKAQVMATRLPARMVFTRDSIEMVNVPDPDGGAVIAQCDEAMAHLARWLEREAGQP